MTIDLARFHRTFFDESFEGLDAMEAALLRLDAGAAALDPETINTIFRAAHSIKGGAGTFGFTDVAGFTHLVETLLDGMRSGCRAVTQTGVDLLLRCVDVTRGMLVAAQDGKPADGEIVAHLRVELEALLAAGAPTATAAAPTPATPQPARWRIRFVPDADLFTTGNDPLRILRELRELGALALTVDDTRLPALHDAAPDRSYLGWSAELAAACPRAAIEEVFAWVIGDCELSIEPVEVCATAPAAAPKAGRPALQVIDGGREPKEKSESSSIRVSTEKIDALINLVGELVITQAMLAQQAAALDPVENEKLLNGLSQLDRNTRMLQEAVMSTRMLPMDFVFSRFPRVVRDLAAKLDKQVRLVTAGESTELDKSVIERIADPLNHLVRNALDHGLESAAERSAAGKDPCGTISLKASHQGGHIVVQVSDDGRGLDRERLLRKARERGLEAPDSLPDADVWQLIFAPGFSTAAVVTDVSGRGVGMDVVKRNIQALGGQVEIATAAGQGMAITIRLPLTLAILDGMSVRVGDEIFIVPLNSVVESLQPRPEQIKSLANQMHLVKVRNEYVPLAPLHEIFRIRADARGPAEGILVLLEAEGRKIAAQVDELVGQQQVVIKSLEANYRRVRGISGATILGDGRVSLILDVGELVRLTGRAQAA